MIILEMALKNIVPQRTHNITYTGVIGLKLKAHNTYRVQYSINSIYYVIKNNDRVTANIIHRHYKTNHNLLLTNTIINH